MPRTVTTRDLDAIPELEWVRLAAFIDGEGCIRIASHGCKTSKTANDPTHRVNSPFVEVIVVNCNVLLVEWLMRHFGGYLQVRPQNNRKWKTSYWWRVSCAYACEILVRAKPFLLLKKEQADVALALQRTMFKPGVLGHTPEVRQEKERLKKRMHELNSRGPRQDETSIN